MATKEPMLKIIQDLPEDASVADTIERLYLLESPQNSGRFTLEH